MMNPILSLPSLINSIAPESLAWWLARVTLISGIACALLAAARNARPALRHLVAAGALVSVALLPAVSALLPSWSLRVLPAPTREAVAPQRTALAIPATIDASPYVAQRAPAEPIGRATTGVAGPSVRYGPAAPTRATIGAPADWKTIAFIVWLNVATALLLQIGLGVFGIRRLLRRSISTTDERLAHECARARALLGIRRPVDVLLSPDVTIPVAVGVWRPRVILPTVALHWSRERLHVVLLHELAHVRRGDGLWMIAAQGITAILWFHPLVWMLSHGARRESERACDDVVLASGVRGSDYAGHLVSIARTAMVRDPLAHAAPAFATRSALSGRVASILATDAPRAALTRRAIGFTAFATAVAVAAIAAARPAAMAPHATSNHADAVVAAATGDGHTSHRTTWSYFGQNHNFNFNGRTRYHVTRGDEDDSGSDSYDRAGDLYERERYESAAEAFQKAADAGYHRATALYNAGCSYALADKPGEAIDALKAAFDAGFDRPDMYASDEDLNSLRGDARFRKLLDEVMNSDEAKRMRRAATRDFERLEGDKNVDEDDWNSVGIDLLRSGDYDKAATAFEREYKVSESTTALYNEACARALAGKSKDALDLLERAILFGPVDADHMSEDADLISLHGDNRFKELLTLADDLELNTGDWVWGDWGFGRKRSEKKRWGKSLPHFEEVTKSHPKVGRAWFNLGFAQLMAGEAEKSTASFKKALDLSYRPGLTMYNMACSSAQSGDIDGAFKWLEQSADKGFEVDRHAGRDVDLEPLRDDPRFEKYEKAWKSQWRDEASHRHHWKFD